MIRILFVKKKPTDNQTRSPIIEYTMRAEVHGVRHMLDVSFDQRDEKISFEVPFEMSDDDSDELFAWVADSIPEDRMNRHFNHRMPNEGFDIAKFYAATITKKY